MLLPRRAFCLAALGCAVGGCRRAPPPAVDSAPRQRRAEAPRAAIEPDAGPPAALPGPDPFADDDELFPAKIAPGAGDWLARFPEREQTFAAYVASRPIRPDGARRRLALRPLGRLDRAARALLETVREHAEMFFGLPVVLAEGDALPLAGRRGRDDHGRRWVQHHTGTLLDRLAQTVPADAVAQIGVTLEDLYPEASWNFVFGEASLDRRVGAYSFARFRPGFTGERDDTATHKRILRRALHLLAHETGHVFGLHHCVTHECVMNGSNSLAEADRQRTIECPRCLRKLAWCLGFDVVARYRALRDFYRRERLLELAVWMDRRLARLGG